MVLFKQSRGLEKDLPITLTDGYIYFCIDTGNFYIDHVNAVGTVVRSKVSAEYADKLRYNNGDAVIEINPSDIVTINNINSIELITVDDIDDICGGAIQYAEDVMF